MSDGFLPPTPQQTIGYLETEVERSRAERDELAEAISDLWHAEVWTDTYCTFCEAHAPTCDAGPIGPIPHGEDCARAAVEAALRRYLRALRAIRSRMKSPA